jgi:hypothetical protein
MPLLVLIIPAAVLTIFVAAAYAVSRVMANAEARLRRRPVFPSLAHELPYWHVTTDGVLVHTDLSYSAILRVRGVDTDCLADEELEQKSRALHSVLSPLEAGLRLQWLYVNDCDQRERVRAYRAGSIAPGAGETLVREKADAMLGAEFRRSRIYLVCTLPPSRLGWLRPTPLAAIDETLHRASAAKLLGLREQLKSGLTAAGHLALGRSTASI